MLLLLLIILLIIIIIIIIAIIVKIKSLTTGSFVYAAFVVIGVPSQQWVLSSSVVTQQEKSGTTVIKNIKSLAIFLKRLDWF